jgi:predicted MFS family arabinose efflux permease
MPALLLAMFATLLLRSSYGPLPALIAADLGIGVPLVAQMLTVETGLTIIAALIIAPLSDRLGRRRTALSGTLLRVSGAILVALAPNFAVLVAGAALLGLGYGALMPQLFGSLADSYPGAARDRRITALIMASRVAMVLAPLLSGFLAAQFQWRLAYIAGAAVTIFSLLAIYRLIPESRPPEDTRHVSLFDLFFTAVFRVLRTRVAVLALLGNLFYGIGAYGIESFLGPFIAGAYELDTGRVGMFLAIGPGVSIAGLALGGRTGLNLRLPILIGTSLVFAVAQTLLLTLQVAPWFMALTYAAWAFGAGLRLTSVWSLIFDLVPNDRGGVTGLGEVSFAGGMMLGTAIGGLALALGGFSALGWTLGAAAILSAFCYWMVSRSLNPA